MKRVIKKHPLAIRWFHWINFPVIAVMVWSGMLIYWANDIYRVGWGNKTVLKFFPDTFYKALHIPFRLAEGMSLHFVFMWIFAINGFIYVLYLLFSGEWRLIFPNKKSLKESFQVVLHDLHLRKTAPDQKKYNAAQRIAYTGVIVMGLGSLLTGLSIYKPIQFHSLVALLGGYEWARAEHFILTILFTLFFLVHIIQVILAGWNNFRSMVTGLDILPAKEIIMQPAGIINEKAVEQFTAPVVPITEPIVTQNEQQVDNVALPNTSRVSTEVKNETSGEISDVNPQEPNKL
ncbi:MAG TPA: cytochrome b/b6 domain-containing protein [Ginsengibacter sp.]|nr:cytochrome b/b6 domain-containing protein [Ginsengibacter sp.]